MKCPTWPFITIQFLTWFQIECDASKYPSGAVLTQLDSNGDRHLCAFISKTFSPTERNYEIYDQKLLAIIWALEEWRHNIQGSSHTTVILSDHKNYQDQEIQIKDKLDGPYTYKSLMSNWSTPLDIRWFNQKHCRDALTSIHQFDWHKFAASHSKLCLDGQRCNWCLDYSARTGNPT